MSSARAGQLALIKPCDARSSRIVAEAKCRVVPDLRLPIRDQWPCRYNLAVTSNPVMFIGDEVRAEVGVTAARTRLASLLSGTALSTASHEAWGEGSARVGPAGPVPGLSKLVQVRVREPVQRGAVTVITLRWEAAGASERLFPVLDADITLIPDGEDATLIGLQGVYGPPAGSAGEVLDRVILHRIAAATIRSFLNRLAAAIQDPALHDGREAGATSLRSAGLRPKST
jgi:hypothetical protein